MRIACLLVLIIGAGFAQKSHSAIIFSDNFDDLIHGASATADLLNGAGGNPARMGQVLPLGLNSWTQTATLQESSIQTGALFMGNGGPIEYTAKFTEAALSDTAPTTVSMMYYDAQSNRTGRSIKGLDANGTALFQLGGAGHHPYEIYDGFGFTTLVTVDWGVGDTFREWEFVLYATTFDVWIDANDDDVKDAGEYSNGLSYINAPTAGFDQLVIRQEVAHSSRGRHSVDDILISQAALPAPVPEPSTWLSFAVLGVCLLGLSRRRIV